MILIYRAKKIDSDEYVEGYLSPKDTSLKTFSITCTMLWKDFIIDPSTLTMSIDGGNNFYSISFITRAIEDHIEATKV